MGFLVGAACGLTVQLYSNAVRKLPLMRHPWEHLLMFGFGGFLGHQFTKWEDQQRGELGSMLHNMNKFGKPSALPGAAEEDGSDE